MNLRRMKRERLGVFIVFAVPCLLAAAFWFNLFSGWQESSTDFFFKARDLFPAASKPNSVVIVAIDDKSLEGLGRFSSWPRSRYVELLEFLREARARVVVFDILFAEPSPDDGPLSEAIRKAGNVIQPVIGTPHSPKRSRPGETVEFERLLRPTLRVQQASSALGHANFLPGEDGAVRDALMLITAQGEELPSLALSASALYLRRPRIVESLPQRGIMPFAGRSIPVDDWQRMVINYLGKPSEPGQPSTFTIVSFQDILEKRVLPDLFTDKLVLVGIMATGEPDSYMTPVSPTGIKMFGVEIHANAIETILRASFLTRQDVASAVETILLTSFTAGLVALKLRPLSAAGAVAGLGIAYLLVTFNMFDRGVILNAVYPPAGLLAAFVSMTLYRVVGEEARRREIIGLFGRYVSPEVEREILAQAEAGSLTLGGSRREVTVLFADLRGFTSLSEKLDPESVVDQLNTYLSAIIEAVLKHRGMVNKFAGDNIMAVWNAPFSQENHARQAVLAGLAAQDAIREINNANPELGGLGFGIGVNSGEAVAGNVGSQQRMEYTVIGDTVNLAARLTGAAGSGEIWIGEDTYRAVAEEFELQEKPGQMFKGKSRETTIYRVIGLRESGGSEAFRPLPAGDTVP